MLEHVDVVLERTIGKFEDDSIQNHVVYIEEAGDKNKSPTHSILNSPGKFVPLFGH